MTVACSDTIDVQMAIAMAGLPSAGQITCWAQGVQARLGTQSHDVCIRIVDREESRTLNREFRGHDKPTNVLSFPADVEGPEILLLGDIVICAPVVFDEALEQGKPAEHHFAHMVVHGLCHLHGYDHEEEEEAAIMESIEVEVLAGYGIADPYQ